MPRNYNKIADYEAQINQLKAENQRLKDLLQLINTIAQQANMAQPANKYHEPN